MTDKMQPTGIFRDLSRGRDARKEWTAGLAPDDAFLIQKIIDNFNAVPHLRLSPL